ncbi:hypothetical protein AAV35_013800 (plasmid) [Salimicrobium jeotgali]|uniref:Uncharacterized protein n=1 Tax=Salimicrobium jeotgali TaxID=1230341 RepID=K2G6I6_9BACI|nr:hypothetical protein [Salimicrobium jeotgali]AKG04114.1 hypothetical protein AAV35_004495 [Salimicrobium jeotgali]AKG05834.1 hypothetical protein AAV35_013800 [Salimicrobium jeotgali]EKE30803.1 hypothetical protein MJ3_11815 [Salimicrobium jeotgali]
MESYTYRENIFNFSQKPSIIKDVEGNEAYEVQLYYLSGVQKLLTQGLGRVTNGATNIFNRR